MIRHITINPYKQRDLFASARLALDPADGGCMFLEG
jgi:hypothetical protein